MGKTIQVWLKNYKLKGGTWITTCIQQDFLVSTCHEKGEDHLLATRAYYMLHCHSWSGEQRQVDFLSSTCIYRQYNDWGCNGGQKVCHKWYTCKRSSHLLFNSIFLVLNALCWVTWILSFFRNLTKAIADVFRRAQHRCCWRDLSNNFRVKFPGMLLWTLFWKAARSYSHWEFKQEMDKIKRLMWILINGWPRYLYQCGLGINLIHLQSLTT